MQNTVIGSKRPVGATCPGGSFGASLATPASAPPNAKHTPKAKQTATIFPTVPNNSTLPISGFHLDVEGVRSQWHPAPARRLDPEIARTPRYTALVRHEWC